MRLCCICAAPPQVACVSPAAEEGLLSAQAKNRHADPLKVEPVACRSCCEREGETYTVSLRQAYVSCSVVFVCVCVCIRYVCTCKAD